MPGHATVADLSAALAAGTLTSAELTRSCLDRIGQLNPWLGAVISVCPDAMAQAAARDSEPASGPLHGIPVLIKDNIAVRGSPATAGSPALRDAESGDAFLVARLRAAGAVIAGKANMSEWANFRSHQSTSGWSTLGGQCVNPYAPGRNPSGSSSGSAAAVAAGLAPLAVGTETDGSIVCPASACGVVGIKPTVGLVSRHGIVPVSLAQDTAGPMAGTVAGAAVLLGVLAGTDPADPATGAALVGDYLACLDAGALDGARIGIWRHGCEEAGPRTTGVLDNAVRLLRERGAQVIDPVELPGADAISGPEFAALTWEFKRDIASYLGGLPDGHPRSLAELIEFNRQNATTVLAHFAQETFERAAAGSADPADPDAQAARAEAARLAQAALDGPLLAYQLDAVLALTANPAWLTDYVLGDHVVFHTAGPAAVAGYPAISVPAGLVAGLPVGVSFTGPAWSEARLIALAHAFEQAVPPLPPPLMPAFALTPP